MEEFKKRHATLSKIVVSLLAIMMLITFMPNYGLEFD